MSSHRTSPRRAPRFDLTGGNVCLDFANTLDDRHTDPKELLKTYIDLAHFAEDTGLLTSSEADRLCERTQAQPREAEKALRHARELREAIHDVFWPLITHRLASGPALERLNDEAKGAAEHLRLVQVGHHFEWQFQDSDDFDRFLWPIARAAADLLASDQLQYVRACHSKQCEWFFLDTSKNHQRRWCDMTKCGNRAKAQRFYARQKS